MKCERGHDLVFDEASRLFLHPVRLDPFCKRCGFRHSWRHTKVGG